jgi:calcium/calmodulin-dependent protein kinase I
MLITCCRIIAYVLLCGYTPFRADDMKEVIRQTTEARVDFHDRYWKNVSDEGTPGNQSWIVGMLTFGPYITAKSFIRALLHPNPARRLTAEQALSHTWLTSFAAPTEHDLCGLRENFDPRARWRNAIGAARAMSRFAKGNGANNNKQKDQQLALSSDDEDDKDKGSRGGSPSSRVTPEPDSKRQQQQHLSPPSAGDRTPQDGLAGLVAKGARTSASSSSSSPMSFSDALNKAKAAAEAEKARGRDALAPRVQATAAASQPRNTQEDEEDDEEEGVELRMPGSFDFGVVDHGAGGARETPGAETVDPFDAVGVLGNLWRRMQVR